MLTLPRPIIALAAVTLALSLAAFPAQATTLKSPHLVVTPSTGLVNKRAVKVSGTGFKPHDTVYIVQCLSRASGGSQCNILGATPVTITSRGVLPLTVFHVVTGKIGTGRCGTTKVNLKSCDLSAGNAAGSDSATAHITFKLK